MADDGNVARTAARGVAWNMAFGLGSRVVQLIGTLILTRFIAPEAYGAVIGASIVVSTAGVFTSFAFGQYLIAQRASAAVAYQATVIHIVLGILTMAVIVTAREPLAAWLETPAMAPFMGGFAIAHLFERVRYVPERLLMRELRFRTLASVNGSGELLFTGVALALATSQGPWAIMLAAIARAAWGCGWFLALSPRAAWWAPTRLERATVRRLVGYGLPITVAAIADRAATRWDSLLMSNLFGPAVMARYNLSYSLAEMPVSHVAEHIGEVLMPSFAKMEDAQRRPAVVRAAALMSLVVSPLGVGLGAVAPTVVAAFFGPAWGGMETMLVLLSVMTVFRPMTWSAVAYLQAVGETKVIMYLSFVRGVAVLSAVAIGGTLGGPIGACVAVTCAYAVHAISTIVAAGRITRLPVVTYLLGVARPLIACGPMFAAVWAVGETLGASMAPAPLLAIQLATGAVSYVAAVFVVAAPTARAFIGVARGLARRR